MASQWIISTGTVMLCRSVLVTPPSTSSRTREMRGGAHDQQVGAAIGDERQESVAPEPIRRSRAQKPDRRALSPMAPPKALSDWWAHQDSNLGPAD